MYTENQIVRYHFTNKEHSLPKAPHGNSGGSTPYERQLKSTRDLLKVAAKTNKPKEACVQVEEELGGIDQVSSTSALPRNKQQVDAEIFSRPAHFLTRSWHLLIFIKLNFQNFYKLYRYCQVQHAF